MLTTLSAPQSWKTQLNEYKIWIKELDFKTRRTTEIALVFTKH